MLCHNAILVAPEHGSDGGGIIGDAPDAFSLNLEARDPRIMAEHQVEQHIFIYGTTRACGQN